MKDCDAENDIIKNLSNVKSTLHEKIEEANHSLTVGKKKWTKNP